MISVLIRDVIKDRIDFKNYLTQQLNLSSSVADTLIQSTLQYTTVSHTLSLTEFKKKYLKWVKNSVRSFFFARMVKAIMGEMIAYL